VVFYVFAGISEVAGMAAISPAKTNAKTPSQNAVFSF
jgi:hypothetical protein